MSNKSRKFSIKERANSFTYAITGLKTLFKEEHNARIHVVAGIVVIVAGLFFKISGTEWLAIIISIELVFMAEIFNTAIEVLADFVSPAYHEQIKKVKDMTAAGVLIASLVAIVVGLIVFLPKLIVYLTALL